MKKIKQAIVMICFTSLVITFIYFSEPRTHPLMCDGDFSTREPESEKSPSIENAPQAETNTRDATPGEIDTPDKASERITDSLPEADGFESPRVGGGTNSSGLEPTLSIELSKDDVERNLESRGPWGVAEATIVSDDIVQFKMSPAASRGLRSLLARKAMLRRADATVKDAPLASFQYEHASIHVTTAAMFMYTGDGNILVWDSSDIRNLRSIVYSSEFSEMQLRIEEVLGRH